MQFKPIRFGSGSEKKNKKFYFLMGAFWILSFLSSQTIYSQATNAKLSISFTNTSFEQAIKEIKNQSGYEFVYTREQLKKSLPVSFVMTSASLKQVLDWRFR
jgi:hypothetical protein